MVRNLLGSLFALAGSACALWSPFRPWFAGRLGRDYRLQDLFTATGITAGHDTIFYGLFLPMLVAAGLALLLAVPLRSRALLATASIVVLGFTVLWMVRQGQAAGTLTVGGGSGSLGDGVAYAWAGGLLLLIAAAVLRGRRPRRYAYGPEPGGPDEYAPYDDYDHGYGSDFDRGYGYGRGGYGYPPAEEQPPGHAPYRRPRPDPYGRPPGPYDGGPPQPPPGPEDPTPPQPWEPPVQPPPVQPPPEQPQSGGSHEAGRPPPEPDDTRPLPRRPPPDRPDDG